MYCGVVAKTFVWLGFCLALRLSRRLQRAILTMIDKNTFTENQRNCKQWLFALKDCSCEVVVSSGDYQHGTHLCHDHHRLLTWNFDGYLNFFDWSSVKLYKNIIGCHNGGLIFSTPDSPQPIILRTIFPRTNHKNSDSRQNFRSRAYELLPTSFTVFLRVTEPRQHY